uniref:Uncharacterized protein n=1 Tax=Pipistrellus kuhlii TaxID=59472 RepID=A0A7J7TW50_PIPKU|nr:hypothetical protein mPipKuh1_009266 [Pipistrellus kuhlii]
MNSEGNISQEYCASQHSTIKRESLMGDLWYGGSSNDDASGLKNKREKMGVICKTERFSKDSKSEFGLVFYKLVTLYFYRRPFCSVKHLDVLDHENVAKKEFVVRGRRAPRCTTSSDKFGASEGNP